MRRVIIGQERRYIERMEDRMFIDQKDAFFVDSEATYRGAPADDISGLDWLEGKTVSILADGAVHSQRVVTNGAIHLDVEASIVHVSLSYESDLCTLPMIIATKDGSTGQGRYKNVNQAWTDAGFPLLWNLYQPGRGSPGGSETTDNQISRHRARIEKRGDIHDTPSNLGRQRPDIHATIRSAAAYRRQHNRQEIILFMRVLDSLVCRRIRFEGARSIPPSSVCKTSSRESEDRPLIFWRRVV
ncbi:MAG: hypothetical protein LBU11_00090 [Zoogloeaceae bacterium]|nr:hypothetical protein [Zoogloeaceae bacterium]